MPADIRARRTIRAFAILVAAIASCVMAASARAGHEDSVEKARLEKMLADGDSGMIVQVFRRHPGATLPFIDRYFEGGLAMIEKGQADPAAAGAKALESFRTGIKFAALADQAFGGDAFSSYANSFASWSPSEQKSFREGQRAFKEGAKEADPAKAKKRLKESLALAKSLGDLWGQAMAQGALAELAFKAGENDAALAAVRQAIDLNNRLQLREDCVGAMRLAAGVFAKMGNSAASSGYLAQAWMLIEPDADFDPAVRQETLKEYLAALEAVGQKAQADQVRKEQAE